MKMNGRIRRGSVNPLVSFTMVFAFLLCAAYPLCIGWLESSVAGAFDCSYLIPKLNRVITDYPMQELCAESNKLYFALYFLLSTYLLSSTFIIFYLGINYSYLYNSYRSISMDHIFTIIIGITIIFSIAIYYRLDLSLKPGRIKISDFKNLRDYADSQIAYLMWVTNGLAFFFMIVTLTVICRRQNE